MTAMSGVPGAKRSGCRRGMAEELAAGELERGGEEGDGGGARVEEAEVFRALPGPEDGAGSCGRASCVERQAVRRRVASKIWCFGGK